jgi:hypothetical protein
VRRRRCARGPGQSGRQGDKALTLMKNKTEETRLGGCADDDPPPAPRVAHPALHPQPLLRLPPRAGTVPDVGSVAPGCVLVRSDSGRVGPGSEFGMKPRNVLAGGQQVGHNHYPTGSNPTPARR